MLLETKIRSTTRGGKAFKVTSSYVKVTRITRITHPWDGQFPTGIYKGKESRVPEYLRSKSVRRINVLK